MKKLIAFFTKGSKILKIAEYVYKGILVAIDVVELVEAEIRKLKPDFSHFDAIDKVLDYLNKAAAAVKKIVEWLGGDVDACVAAAKAEVAACGAGPVDDKQQKLDKLSGIGNELDKIVAENK